jgi:DNA-binding response OmpR family regulator
MRVFLVCEDERLKLALLMLVDNQPDMVVSGISDRLDSLAIAIHHSDTEALILAWKLPLQMLEKLVAEIRALQHPPQIIYLSNRPEMEDEVKEIGVDFFVAANAPPDRVVDFLKEIQIAHVDSRHPARRILTPGTDEKRPIQADQ